MIHVFQLFLFLRKKEGLLARLFAYTQREHLSLIFEGLNTVRQCCLKGHGDELELGLLHEFYKTEIHLIAELWRQAVAGEVLSRARRVVTKAVSVLRAPQQGRRF